MQAEEVSTVVETGVDEVQMQPKELTREEAIEKILDMSGLDVQVPQIADSIMLQFNEYLKRAPEDMRSKISDIVTLAFDGDAMLETVKKEVSKKVSLEEAKKMLEWYVTDTAMEITKIEEDPIESAGYRDMLEQKEELLSNVSRTELCKKIDKAAHVTESALNMQIGIMRSMAKVAQPDMDEGKLREILDKQRTEMEDSTRDMYVLTMLYTYKDLDEKELRAYIDFLGKSTTQSFINSANSGISKAMVEGTDKMVKGFMELKPVSTGKVAPARPKKREISEPIPKG
jgi:hypothetical protein